MKKLFIIACLLFAIGCAKKENRCPYEGAECPNVQTYLRDYQIEVYYDTVWIYDADRLVGRYVSNWQNQMDSIILKDNE